MGWLAGCNFTPSTASNQLEFWQAATFDPETIDRELGWAADLGFNAMRVFLHDLLWTHEGDVFLDRVDQVLDIAAGHGIGFMPVLFDGVWDPEPALGPQAEPVPGVHNSRWVQGPGAAILLDESRWPEVRPYVEAVLDRFGRDERVLVWDLFNEPAQRDRLHWKGDALARKSEAACGLTSEVFAWARDVDAEQPLTVGLYGDLRLLVIIRKDGSLEGIEVLKSSGYAVLDEAAIKIVRMAAPFSPFPAELSATTDKLEIIRTWQFQENELSSK